MPLPVDWLRAIGPLPDTVALDARVSEEVDCGAFFRSKVSYQVEADERISAYLCVPKGLSKKAPAVFCHHQHGGQWHLGKHEPVGLAGDPDLAYAKELSERGFITLTPDLPCFGERAAAEDAADANYFELAKRLILGKTLLAKVIHEVSVGIDLLQSHAMVDERRIGFIGHSYGGRTAFFAAAHDDRITATVSSCGSTTYRDMLNHRTGIQLEFIVPGIVAVGDLDVLLRAIEPRSIMVLGARDDKWSLRIDDLVRQARPHFKVGELVGHTGEGAHGFPRSGRLIAYAFLERHLVSRRSAV